ncbi:MAG: YggU family protein [Planctomycetota bacterium]|nr:MAG: YggU family protein [Planctomycetota bacterium]
MTLSESWASCVKHLRGSVATLSELSAALLQTPDGVVIRVYVQPKARREQIVGMHGDRLKLAVTEPPDKGKATAAVLRLLAASVNIAPSQTETIRGDISRQKDVLLRGLTVPQVAAAILEVLKIAR